MKYTPVTLANYAELYSGKTLEDERMESYQHINSMSEPRSGSKMVRKKINESNHRVQQTISYKQKVDFEYKLYIIAIVQLVNTHSQTP